MNPLSSFAASWSALSGLLDHALALPAGERAAWLDGLSGEQASHREALRTLLAQQALVETGDFLSALPVLDAPALGIPSVGLTAGTRVGAYQLVAKIGTGGMGTVWAADRADGLLSRRVALKLPHIVWGDAFTERLVHERRILATLEHEHIARLYDAGVDGHSRPYIAMELVAGEPIDVYCRLHELSVRNRVALLLQVMGAVAHAHARLVVHRDLKPSNILVTHEGKVKLLDFGIAKLLEHDGAWATDLTQRAGRALTPDYASPEQIRGEPLATSGDVYSLGVIAYELLTGAKPYRLKRGTAAELEEAITTAEPRPASDAAASPAARKSLRGDLDAILQRALKKSVAERYASVDAFADDLRRYLRGEPVTARPDSSAYRALRFAGRHRLAVSMTIAVLLSLALGGGLSLWQARVAWAEERRASAEIGRQRAILDLYIETLSRLSVLVADDPKGLTSRGGLSTVLRDKLREMGPRFANRPGERAAQLEAVMLQLNYCDRFEDSLVVGAELLEYLNAHDGTPSQVVNTYTSLGRTLFQLQRYEESEAMRRAGTLWAPQAHDHDTVSSRMQVASDLGGLLTARGKRREARAVLTNADVEMAQRFASEHQRFENMSQLALFHLGFDDGAALQLMRQSRAELVANGGAEPRQLADNGWMLGDTLLATGNAAEAEAALTESLGLYRREYGRESRNGVRAFGRLMGAVARHDPHRADAMIDAERHFLAAQPTGMSRYADLTFRARELEAAWLVGDTAAAMAVSLPEEAALMTATSVRDNDFVLIHHSRALVQAGRAKDALPALEALHARWPERGLATWQWLRIEEALADAQLSAGENAAAAATAGGMLRMLEQEGATAGRSYRAASALAALAAARSNNRSEATRLLAGLAKAAPVFPSAAERADCELRRAQALVALGRIEEAASIARVTLATLEGQHPESPRTALAKRLAAQQAAT